MKEPVADFITAAKDLHRIIDTMRDVRHATEGDADALGRLRKRFGGVVKARNSISREDLLVDADDRTIQIYASQWAAWGLSDGLISARAYVYDRADHGEDVPPGQLRVGILPETLLEVGYLTIAIVLADKEPLEICPDCGRAFVVEDGRQKFCTPACANRTRFRRFQSKKKQPRRTHVRQTRKR